MIKFEVLRDSLDLKEENYIIAGIDEAGRGPVIGPLVVAYVEVDSKILRKLIKLGVRDSKMLSPNKRKTLFRLIMTFPTRIVIAKIDPDVIDEWVLGKKGLNSLEAYVVSRLIEGYRVCARKIYIDAPSNETSYREYLSKYGVRRELVIVEIKADKKWPVVSMASVIAKVIRDEEIDALKRKLGIDFGSGYPSDPKTRSALPILIKLSPEIVRKSWKTIRKIMKGNSF